MKFIDGFAGVGGFRLPLEQLGHECVWSCEIDKYCEQVYRYNFGEGYDAKDIKKVRTSNIPEHDLFCAGFPCPDFSIAGQRKGLEGAHGELFYEIVRIARDKRTPYLLLENVRGLLSSNGGWDFARIQIKLGKLGYDIQWQVLNSKNYGVPQNRERVFIIGHLGGYPRPQVFPIGENGGIFERTNKAEKGQKETKIIPTIETKLRAESPYILSPDPRNENRPSIQKARKKGLPDPGGCGQLYRNDGLSYTIKAFTPQWVTKSLTAGGHSGGLHSDMTILLEKDRIRRLTPLEFERLQGFPDGWTERGIDEEGVGVRISDTQRYKMMGNAVTVPVIKAIGERFNNA